MGISPVLRLRVHAWASSTKMETLCLLTPRCQHLRPPSPRRHPFRSVRAKPCWRPCDLSGLVHLAPTQLHRAHSQRPRTRREPLQMRTCVHGRRRNFTGSTHRDTVAAIFPALPICVLRDPLREVQQSPRQRWHWDGASALISPAAANPFIMEALPGYEQCRRLIALLHHKSYEKHPIRASPGNMISLCERSHPPRDQRRRQVARTQKGEVKSK